MGECRSRGGYRMRVRNKENNWCYEKRLSTSRYEFRRPAFCESRKQSCTTCSAPRLGADLGVVQDFFHQQYPKENNWCYEKRLSTSRYEFRRL